MATGSPGAQLLGRQHERDVLERLLEGAREGRGGVLAMHGEPGVGKTALLEYAVEVGQDFRVVRTAGVEGEMKLDYAALQQLCSPILEFSERLPDPQRDALGVAFGLSAGQAPSPFLVGLAVLGLLSEAAEQQPLLCVVDDSQWLDGASAQALAFVAHRLLAERIALVFATRDVGSGLARLPELRVEPLGRRDARTLLESVLVARLDESVLERIVAETGGNPLALLELPRGLTPGQLAGGFGLPAALPLSTGIEQSFTRRLAQLPRDVAAAAALGGGRTGRRPCASVARGPAARDPGDGRASRGVGGFPDARRCGGVPSSARALGGLRCGRAERAARGSPRAGGRNRSAARPGSPRVAPCAGGVRARRRGGRRARALRGTGAGAGRARRCRGFPRGRRDADPRTVATRTRRALAAAQTKFQAGALDDALSLLAMAETGALSDLERARAALLRAQTAFVATRGSNAPPLLLEAARRLATLDPTLARETYLDALSAGMFAGRFAGPGGGALEVAQAASAAPPPRTPRGSDLLLDALATLFGDTYEAAVPILRRAQAAFGTDESAIEQLRWLWLATIASVQLWDDAGWETLSERHVRLARRTGALSDLPLALTQRVYMHLLAGELTAAASLVDEIEAATDAIGSTLAPYGKVGLAALRGREVEAVDLIGRTRTEVTRRGEGIGVSVVDWAEAVLYNGLARYEEARSAALRVVDHPDLNPSTWVMPEVIEAAVRAGTPELAADTHRRLVDMTRVSGTDWALGLAARSQALLVEDQRAEELYVCAIERLGRTRIRADLARAHLLYGEWLRRERRRLDARKELRLAYDLFSDFGMEAFAERARVELEATGEHARRRTVDTLGQLTPQEAQISRLVAQGYTNREIAAQLFISPSTVEYHLRKVFRKLDVKSRTQLARRMS